MYEQIKELREMGFSYLSAANYLKRVMIENERNAKSNKAYNDRIRREAQKARSIDEMEAEIERLEKLLADKKVKAQTDKLRQGQLTLFGWLYL